MRVAVLLLLAPIAMAPAATGCQRDRVNIVALRDALAQGSGLASATGGAPSCAMTAEAGARAPEACLGEIATWLGSKTGFRYDAPDQASAATAALVVARDGKGEWVPAPDAWLFTVKSGSGVGADALRFAMAEAIAERAGSLPHLVQTDDDARALMRAVAASVPGACDTYARLGAGMDVNAGPPERTADHSPCVQKDLERATGPAEHGKYGTGLWRGAMGALALWREAGEALKEGVAHADEGVRGVLEAKVGRAEAVLGEVVPEPKAMAASSVNDFLLNGRHMDAGVFAKAPPLPAPSAPAARATAARPAGSSL
jgi:hypothetical protein